MAIVVRVGSPGPLSIGLADLRWRRGRRDAEESVEIGIGNNDAQIWAVTFGGSGSQARPDPLGSGFNGGGKQRGVITGINGHSDGPATEPWGTGLMDGGMETGDAEVKIHGGLR